MFCGNCGKQNPDNANVCGYCGHRFKSPGEETVPITKPATAQPVYIPATKTVKKPQNNTNILLIGIVIGVVIAAIAGVAAYKLTSDDNKADTKDSVAYKNKDTEDENIIDKYTGSKDKTTRKSDNEEANDKQVKTEKNDTKPADNSQAEEIEEPEIIEEQPVIEDEYIQPTKKDEYLATASGIEEYSSLYLDTAVSQHQMNSESAIVFEKWDVLLNDVYNYLRETLPADEFAALESDEVDWIIEKENAIAVAGEEWAGGSMEPLARNTTAIRYTEERCYYLISLIN